VFVNAKVRAELFHYLFREATRNNCEAFVFDTLRDVMEHRYQIIAAASLTKAGHSAHDLEWLGSGSGRIAGNPEVIRFS
jgi:hypothetical protein